MSTAKRTLVLTATGLAATLILAACGSDADSRGSMSGMGGHGSSSSSTSSATSSSRAADVMFAQMMVPHHRQAIEMADLALANPSTSADVKALAEQVKAAQDPEIETMNGWLRRWGAPTTASMDHGTGGMMSEEDMASLGAARGPAFNRMWLQMMIEHHRGAVTMAQDVLSSTETPDVKRLAQSVVDGQNTEIATMRGLLGADTGAPRALPSSHVHAVSRDPGTGDLLVATHEGLYVYGKGEPHRVGPNIDLMGFTVAGPRHYLASGHPGPGVDLPQPVGLIESRDGGRTWTVLSRGGSSDFHALAAGGGTVVGFDGVLRVSGDGRSWKTGNLASPPRALAVSPDGRRVLATTADGLMRSTDGGVRWSTVKGAPLLLLVDWADGESVAGLGTDGRVYVSADSGATWRSTAVAPGDVQAMGATGAGKDLSVVAATADRLVARSAEDLLPGR